MRIILGTKTKVEVAGGGEFFCPACKSQNPYTRVRVARYFTFFFIPLFRIRTIGEYIQCRACQREFRSEVLTFTREEIEQATAPWKCPACGNRNSQTENTCLACGRARQQEPPPMPGQPALTPAALILSPPPLAGLGPAKKKSVVGRVILTLFLLWIAVGIGSAILHALFSKNHPETLVEKAGHEEFEAASKSIANSDQGMAHGNTPEARELAARLSEDLGEATKIIPTVGKPDLLDQTGGKFLVFCQRNADSCAFLIHVPNLRHFDTATQKTIAKICYFDACVILRDSGATGIRRVVVAPRGALLYAKALVGSYPPQQPSPEDHLEELTTDASDVSPLYPFFATDTAPGKAESATPAASPMPSPSATPAVSATPAASPKPSASPTPAPSATPSASVKPSVSATPVASAVSEPPEAPENAGVGGQASESRATPSWVPVYPAMLKTPHGTGRESNGIIKGRTTFQTIDPLDKVKEFYESRLRSDGFEITADKSTARIFENAEIAGTKENGKLALRVAIHQMRARTTVILTYEGPDIPQVAPEKPR